MTIIRVSGVGLNVKYMSHILLFLLFKLEIIIEAATVKLFMMMQMNE